jgi:uncharacterized protein (TIGR02270 family)
MPSQRPVGFSPAEISALINKDVVLEHADEAAFLWTLRSAATNEPHYSLKDLAALDERVEAHLDGLRGAAELGWTTCIAGAANGDAGSVFAASILAFGSGSRDWMSEALRAALPSPATRSGMVSALGWLDYEVVAQWIQRLLESRVALHRAVGLAACAVHRREPGPTLVGALDDDDLVLRRCALRTCGQTRRHDLLESILRHLQAADGDCRFWAAWSSVLLGASQAIPVLADVAEHDDRFRDAAMQLALRAMPPEHSRRWVSALAHQTDRARMAVIGTGIVGDPVSIPWLISKMESADLAKVAGEAFCMMTGADLALDDLELDVTSDQDPTNVLEESLGLDYESNLRVPSPELVAAWWDTHRGSFVPGTRYLVGRVINRESALDVLANGKQRQRAAAAIELALIDSEEVLFEVRAPGWRQQEQLAAWIS